jgi:hypothetical protein
MRREATDAITIIESTAGRYPSGQPPLLFTKHGTLLTAGMTIAKPVLFANKVK